MQKRERLDWIDIVRAMAMLFVIYVHLGSELAATGIAWDAVSMKAATFMNPVKLPLFFAISGYLYSARCDDWSCFGKRLVRTRLVPYLVWGSFMGIVAFGMDLIRSGMNASMIPELLVSNYLSPLVRGNLIWFIPCLMIMESLFFLLLKLSRKNLIVLAAMTMLCAAAGYAFSADGVVKVWKWDTALTGMQFMTFGYMIRHAPDRRQSRYPEKAGTAIRMGLYLLMLIAFARIWDGCGVDMNMGSYFHPVAFTVLACTGVLAFFSLSKQCAGIRSLRYIGRNSLLYFVWHMYAAKLSIAVMLRTPFLTRLPMCLVTLIVLAATCGLVALVCAFVNRFFGFTVGRK